MALAVLALGSKWTPAFWISAMGAMRIHVHPLSLVLSIVPMGMSKAPLDSAAGDHMCMPGSVYFLQRNFLVLSMQSFGVRYSERTSGMPVQYSQKSCRKFISATHSRHTQCHPLIQHSCGCTLQTASEPMHKAFVPQQRDSHACLNSHSCLNSASVRLLARMTCWG